MFDSLASWAPDDFSRTQVNRINNNYITNDFRKSSGTRRTVCSENNQWSAVGGGFCKEASSCFGFDVCN